MRHAWHMCLVLITTGSEQGWYQARADEDLSLASISWRYTKWLPYPARSSQSMDHVQENWFV